MINQSAMKKPQILKVQEDLSIPWFKQIKKTVLFANDPEPQTFYSIKPPDYVTVLAQTRDKKVIILKQFRPSVEDYTFELPSGHVENGETHSQAVIRELREETGCIAKDVKLLGGVIPDTGRLENRLWAYYIRDVETVAVPGPEYDQGVEVLLVSCEELFHMIESGQFNHALDLSVIMLAILKKYLSVPF